jgi:hypothetical protein
MPRLLKRGWRWGLLGAVVGVLVLVPVGLARLPATSSLDPSELRDKIRASKSVPYQGLAESNSGLGLPDVPRAGRLVELFSERTRMRAWVAGPSRWRVDALTPIGERDTYRDRDGTWIWDSGEQSALRVLGEGAVRFARPADLLPPELGRRLIEASTAAELTPLAGRRVANVDAAGLRIEPDDADTTIARVHVWADPATGLPLRVEVFPRGSRAPLLSTSFLELRQEKPTPELVEFSLPTGADVQTTSAPDFARAVDHFSPYVLPDRLAGASRRMEVGGAAATYGEGFSVVAVLALPESSSPRAELSALPVVDHPWGSTAAISTPLLNGMFFRAGDVAYFLAGSITMGALERVAAELAHNPLLEVQG